MKEKEASEAKLKEQGIRNRKLIKKIQNLQKRKEKQTQEMRDKVNKLEEQRRQIDDLERNQLDLKQKTNAIMRNLDHEMGIKKKLEREQEALERRKTNLSEEIKALKKARKFTEKVRSLTRNSIYHLEQQVEASRRLGYDDLKIMEDLFVLSYQTKKLTKRPMSWWSNL